MKTIIHSSIAIIILLLLIGCNNKNRVEKRIDDDGFLIEYHFSNDTLYYYKMFYPSGKLLYEVPLANGLPTGIETEYYEDGSIKQQGVRTNNLATGWHYYYGINQQVDSIIEFIPSSPNIFLAPIFSNTDDESVSMRSRSLIYEDGEINAEKSIFFEISLERDTVLLGDTVNVSVDFMNQTNNQKNEIQIWFRDGDGNIIRASYSDNRGQVVLFDFISKARGEQMLHGMIREFLPNDEIKDWFFKQSYYVK